MRLLPKSPTSLLLLLCLLPLAGFAKAKPPAPDRQDHIEVIAHLPLAGTEPVTRFFETRHYNQEYLYAEHVDHEHVTLINVTAADHPTVMSEIQLPTQSPADLISVVGNSALIEAQSSTSRANSNSSRAATQTYRIMSFLDPAHPTVKREFTGVTAIASDDKRGLIFLANNDGMWVLRQKFAMSPEAEALQTSIERSIFDTP